MALFKSLRGKRENLPSSKTDGYAYFCTDDGTFWIDYKDENGVVQRKQINADEAAKLTTSRAITVNLSSEGPAAFDGSTDITPGVSNTLGVTHGGTGRTSIPSGNYLIGNLTGAFMSKTPTEVLSDIKAVGYGAAQSLSDAQKVLARSNINAQEEICSIELGSNIYSGTLTTTLSGDNVSGNLNIIEGQTYKVIYNDNVEYIVATISNGNVRLSGENIYIRNNGDGTFYVATRIDGTYTISIEEATITQIDKMYLPYISGDYIIEIDTLDYLIEQDSATIIDFYNETVAAINEGRRLLLSQSNGYSEFIYFYAENDTLTLCYKHYGYPNQERIATSTITSTGEVSNITDVCLQADSKTDNMTLAVGRDSYGKLYAEMPGADDVKAVSYNTVQTLTDGQKSQARENIGALSSDTAIPSKTSDLTNDSGFLTSYTETDPTVPAWAKAANKPTYTASEVGAAPASHINDSTVHVTAEEKTAWNAKADAPFKPSGKSYLTFSSPNSFTLAVGDTTKHWNGILEYFAADKTWSTWDGTTTLSSVDNDGDNVLYLRGTGNTKITGNSTNYKWVLTGSDISCIGNIENLLDYATVEAGNHPTMASYCYYSMFRDCTSLTQAPALPATTLTTRCYYYMFYGCTSLTQAPDLPATTLATSCYQYMFYGCTSLTQAPALPATTLADQCYFYMFAGCTSLTQAPTLPATTLVPYCYDGMFLECTSLTQAPTLPATTLADYCYGEMFRGCTNLKLSTTQTGEYTQEYRIPSSGTGTTATDAITNMFTSTGGTFTGTPSINTTYYLSSSNMVVHETEIATLNGYVGSMIDAAIGNAIGGSY